MAINLLPVRRSGSVVSVKRWRSSAVEWCGDHRNVTIGAAVVCATIGFTVFGAKQHERISAIAQSADSGVVAPRPSVLAGIGDGSVRTLTIETLWTGNVTGRSDAMVAQRQFTETVDRAINAWLAEHRECRVQSTNVLTFDANQPSPTGMYVVFTCDR